MNTEELVKNNITITIEDLGDKRTHLTALHIPTQLSVSIDSGDSAVSTRNKAISILMGLIEEKQVAKFKEAPHAPVYEDVVVRVLVTTTGKEPVEYRASYTVPADMHQVFLSELESYFESANNFQKL